MAAAKRGKIAIQVVHQLGFGRAIARGAAAAAAALGHAAFLEDIALAAADLRAMGYTGALRMDPSPAWHAAAAVAGLPAVNVSSRSDPGDIPSVLPDNVELGRLAAEHLQGCGMSSFAWLGIGHTHFSTLRYAGFRDALARRRFRVRAYAMPVKPLATRAAYAEHLRDWLGELPHPVAVFAASDTRAADLLSAATMAGLRVPDDVAVMGVDNDDLLCHLLHPTLSSVDPSGEEIGRAAARMLDRIVRNENGERRALVSPRGVVARGSTEIVVAADPGILAAIRFIRGHGLESISVEDVMAAVRLSRRTLERGMRQAIGRTPAQEIIRLRLAHACHLLQDTDLRLKDIARVCQYANYTHFCSAFRTRTGLRPHAYRARFAPPPG